MEPLRPQQEVTLTRRAVLSGLALAALAPLGCLGRGFLRKDAAAPPPPKGRVVSTWDPKVAYAPDASRGGAVMPGLVGRVFLFGPDMAVPYLGDGRMVIDLFDATPRGSGVEPKVTDHFEIDPNALRQLANTDVFGEGYSIFFPWFNYHPDVSRVYLQLAYIAPDGEKYFHQSGTFNVDHAQTKEIIKKGMPVSKAVLQTSAFAPAQ